MSEAQLEGYVVGRIKDKAQDFDCGDWASRPASYVLV